MFEIARRKWSLVTFGTSGPVKRVQKELGFTKEAVMKAARRVMERQPRKISEEADVMRAWKRRKSKSEF